MLRNNRDRSISYIHIDISQIPPLIVIKVIGSLGSLFNRPMVSPMATAITVTLYVVLEIMPLIISIVLVVFKMTSEGGGGTITGKKY